MEKNFTSDSTQSVSIADKYLHPTEAEYNVSHRSGAPAEESPYLKRLFWSGYKGYTRGVLGGVTLFTVMGVAIGAGILGAGMLAGASIPALIIPSFGLFGAAYGDKLFGENGRESGQIATALEILQERETVKELIKGKSPAEAEQILRSYVDPYYDEQTPDKWYHGRVGALGALVGGLLGCLAGMAGGFVDPSIATSINWGTAAIGTTGGVIGGATFGVDRSIFRQWFKVTNNVYDKNKGEELRVEKVRNTLRQYAPEIAATLESQEANQQTFAKETLAPESPETRKTDFAARIKAELAARETAKEAAL